MLTEETRMLDLAFDNLGALIEHYVRDVPRITFALEKRDLSRFLDWLRHTQRLNSQQADFVAYQQAECACLAMAGTERTAYLEFQRRWRALSEQVVQVEIDPVRRIDLNPIQVWARLSGIAVGADTEEPQDVVFFAHQGEVRMFWRPEPAMRPLGELRALARCTLDAWRRAAGIEPTEAVSLAHELCEAGLAIFL